VFLTSTQNVPKLIFQKLTENEHRGSQGLQTKMKQNIADIIGIAADI